MRDSHREPGAHAEPGTPLHAANGAGGAGTKVVPDAPAERSPVPDGDLEVDLVDEGAQGEEDWPGPEDPLPHDGPAEDGWEHDEGTSDPWPDAPGAPEPVDVWSSDAEGPGEDWLVGPPSPDDEPTRPLGPLHVRTTVGYWERVDLPDLGVKGLDALCDTSASRSSLRVLRAPQLDEGGPFALLDLGNEDVPVDLEEWEDARLLRTRIRVRGVMLEASLVVETCNGPATVVLGRDLLAGRFVVDVSLPHPRDPSRD